MTKRTALFLTLAAGLVAASAQPLPSSPLTYQEFLTRARALHDGQTRAEIIAGLGKPVEENAAHMTYVLTGLKGFPGMPGPIGTQVFPEAEIPLHGGHMAGAIIWAWVDSTGSAPRKSSH